MTQQTYTFSWILPYVRRAIKGVSNLNFNQYLGNLWSQLEKDHIAGAERHTVHTGMAGTIRWEGAPYGLQDAATEAFFYLSRNGYITPQPPHSGHPNHPAFDRYNVTERGLEWAKGDDPLPEDISGYMKFLHGRIPNLDKVVEQYIADGLLAFERGAHFAAAVMLGTASEKAIYLLADAMVGALKHQTSVKKLQELMTCRSLNLLFTFVRDALDRNHKLPTIPYEGAPHLMSLFDAIRTQRNDAVHPATGQVSADSVRLLTASLPYALSKTEELCVWLKQNPQSLA
jgi:hypothetical protein